MSKHIEERSNRMWHRLALAVALVWVATGCATPPPRPVPAPALRVGTSGDYPPFSEWTEAGPRGFSVALVEAFAAEQGLALEWVRFRWPELVAGLDAGRFTLASSGITVRPERSVVGRASVPVAINGAVLLLRRPGWAPLPANGRIPGGLEEALAEVRAVDRPELRVAVNQGGHLERVARGLFRHAQVLAIPDNAGVREALATGKVDAALSNTVEGPRWAQGLEDVELLGPLTRDVVALYVRADAPELAARLDTWLLAQEENGALARLRVQHLGQGASEATARPVEALLAATAERLSLMPWVAEAKARTGGSVEDATQEARVLESVRARVREASVALGVAPPPDEVVDAFFQAQMEAAKAVQRRAGPTREGPAFALDTQLRPAVARITERMAALVVRLPPGLEREAVGRQARDWLGTSGLEPTEVRHLAEALTALAPPPGGWPRASTGVH